MQGPVLVAGAGIGGLTVALALAGKGFEVRVFERADALSEAGAGLQLSPNAARILRDFHMEPRLDAAVGRPEALVVRSAGGRTLVEMPLGAAAEQRWGAPSLVAHRADLQAALLQAVSGEKRIAIVLGAAAADCTVSGETVALGLERAEGTRSSETGPLLIAADGVHSLLRRHLVADGPPSHTGLSAFRALVPMDEVPRALRRNVTGLWLGPRGHLVHYPLRGGTIVNLVAVAADDPPASGSFDALAAREEVLARFRDFSQEARALIALPHSYRRWPLYDRAPETRWPEGRVAFLGDAAHPMGPFLAQGAAMAIEDAAVLARCLSEAAVPDALARYRAERLPRVARVQREARRNALLFHLPAPLAWARDLGLKAMGGAAFAARYDWLYGWRDDSP